MKRGFTLTELLVVILIIGILAAVAVPMYQNAVDKSRYATLMPMAKAIHDAQEVYYMAVGSYSKDLSNLDSKLPGNAEGGSASFADGISAEISTEKDDYRYVKMSKEGLNNNYIFYQERSRNFPGEIHCEALQENERAQQLCRTLGGQYIGGSLTDGYDTYILEGSGDGMAIIHGSNTGENGNEDSGVGGGSNEPDPVEIEEPLAEPSGYTVVSCADWYSEPWYDPNCYIYSYNSGVVVRADNDTNRSVLGENGEVLAHWSGSSEQGQHYLQMGDELTVGRAGSSQYLMDDMMGGWHVATWPSFVLYVDKEFETNYDVGELTYDDQGVLTSMSRGGGLGGTISLDSSGNITAVSNMGYEEAQALVDQYYSRFSSVPSGLPQNSEQVRNAYNNALSNYCALDPASPVCL